jgi:hypothetical protein
VDSTGDGVGGDGVDVGVVADDAVTSVVINE